MDAKQPSGTNRATVRGARSLFHLGVVALMAIILWVSGIDWSQFALSARVDLPAAAVPTTAPRLAISTPPTVRGIQEPVRSVQPLQPLSRPAERLAYDLAQSPVAHTTIPERPRREVITYTVQAGDNVSSIAERFDLQRESIVWANEELETDPDLLHIGQVLSILPVDGAYHTVQEGETLASIAEQYQVSVEAIVDCPYNGFPVAEEQAEEVEPGIVPGQKLIVPGGVKPFKPRFIRYNTGVISRSVITAAGGEGSFVWPVAGTISQEYWNLHRAVDIAGPQGDVVVAADAGVVVYASWESNGYGYLVIIDHGNGFTTYYAHLYGFYVDVGQSVERGQPIGARGSTGRSTGPHLHFELRQDGVQRDPLAWLSQE